MSGWSIVIACIMAGCVFTAGVMVGFSFGARAVLRSTRLAPSPLMHQLLAALSALLFVFTLGAVVYSAYFIFASTTVSGRVSDIRQTIGKDNHVSTQVFYQYADASGAMREGWSGMADESTHLGQSMPVRFLNHAPWQSRLDTFSGHWALPSVLCLLGIGLAVASYLTRRNYLRRNGGWVKERRTSANPNPIPPQ